MTLLKMIPYRVTLSLTGANYGTILIPVSWTSLDNENDRVSYVRIRYPQPQQGSPIEPPSLSVLFSHGATYEDVTSGTIDFLPSVETEVDILFDSNYTDLTVDNFVVYFINMYCARNKVDKSWYSYALSSGDLKVKKISLGTLRESSSTINPIVSFEWEPHVAPDFNYVYIPSFNRFFFVNDISFVMNNLWVMRLSVDVLNTYKDEIKTLNAFIERQENDYNLDIEDNLRTYEQDEIISYVEIENTVFDVLTSGTVGIIDRGLRYVLTVVD